MLDFPLHDGFFPQMTLTREEVKHYKRVGKTRVAQWIRIIEDADCAYKWTRCDGARRSRRARLLPSRRRSRLSVDATSDTVACHRAKFLAFEPLTKTAQASTLLKASVQLRDTSVDEILHALGKVKTKEFRTMMQYLHPKCFVDGRTLYTFPPTKTSRTNRVPYSYRAIKWHALKVPRSRDRDQVVDFCYLEYSGKRPACPGSNVVGFCIQESITRDAGVPSFESFGIARAKLARMGVIISKTHQAHTFDVTSVCQLDGAMNPLVRHVLETTLETTVGAIARLAGLVTRQRVSRLRFVEPWQWVPNADRKACAVCLRGFYFRRKHHCRTCGEVVCSACATFRELEEPIFDLTHLRVCSVCMTSVPEEEGPTFSTSNETAPSYRLPNGGNKETLETGHEKSDHVHALTQVVTQIRKVQETIEVTLSEADDDATRHDVVQQLERLHDAFETSVSTLDAALITSTTRASHLSTSDDRRDAASMTSAQFHSVAQHTFAAAQATKEAVRTLGEHHQNVALEPECPLQEQPDDSDEPFATVNYEKLMASYPDSDSELDSESDDDKQRRAFASSMRRATEIQALEQQIQHLERSLEEAQRTLAGFDRDEREPTEPVEASSSSEALTQYLVSELRGVMEVTERPVHHPTLSPSVPSQDRNEHSRSCDHITAFSSSSSSSSAASSSSASSSSCSSSSDVLRLDNQDPSRSSLLYVEEDLRAIWKQRHQTLDLSASLDPSLPDSPLFVSCKDQNEDKARKIDALRRVFRPRSSSVPFQSRQSGGVSSGEALGGHQDPSWSEDNDIPDRDLTLHQVEDTRVNVRASLATCRCECPSDTERGRLLMALVNVLRSIQREGLRSKFRTLWCDDILYSTILETAPSLLQLLKLAGYVPHQQTLTMRRVDHEYLALVLREVEGELGEY